jgi:pyruvate/2-oxoglutarate/acetoin dehydrogenase E1 component
MFKYLAFYKGKKIEVMALRSLDARDKAAVIFKARKAWDVTVVLYEHPDGSTVTHSTAAI